MATEQPRYELVDRHPSFEVRLYAPGVLAETVVSGPPSVVSREGFGRLAGFIFGGNQRRQSIAMTAPVVQHRESDGRWSVAFHMPVEWPLERLPAPLDGRVRLRPHGSQRYAARRFRGDWDEGRFSFEAAQLAEAVRASGLRPAGPASWARYDPPWVPPMQRTHDVLLPLE